MIIYYPVCGSGGGDSTGGGGQPITDHNSLLNIQGGTENERYHLSYPQYYANLNLKKFTVNVINNRYAKTKYPMFFGTNNQFVKVYLPNNGQFIDENNYTKGTNESSLGVRTHYQNGEGLSDTIMFSSGLNLPQTVEIQYYEVESPLKPYVIFKRNDNLGSQQRVFKSIINGNLFIHDITYDKQQNMYTLNYRNESGTYIKRLFKYIPDYFEICHSTYSNFQYDDNWQIEVYIRGRNQTCGNQHTLTHYGAQNPIFVSTAKKVDIKPSDFLSHDIKRNNLFVKLRNLNYNIITQPTLIKKLRIVPYTKIYGYVEVQDNADYIPHLILQSVEN